MLIRYLTVKGYGEHEIEIERSRFIAYVDRAESEEEAQAFIQKIKKKHWDATHNCSAYIIGEHDHIQKADDDGEPSGTAGKPILEVLKKRQLKDTVVVITRYFGGIKLGAGGLIRAYGKSTSKGLDAAKIIERQLHTRIMTTIDYTLLGRVENELRTREYLLREIEYLDKVTLHVDIPVGQEERFIAWMIDLTNGQSVISRGKQVYVDQLVSNDTEEEEV